MSLLDRWLTKKGIEKVEDLTKEEKVVYDNYKRILVGENLSIDDIKTFCQAQIRLIEAKCDGIVPLSTMQQACLHVYFNILKIIDIKEAERTQLEDYLNSLINSNDQGQSR